jgi:hypothetical protein
MDANKKRKTVSKIEEDSKRLGNLLDALIYCEYLNECLIFC